MAENDVWVSTLNYSRSYFTVSLSYVAITALHALICTTIKHASVYLAMHGFAIEILSVYPSFKKRVHCDRMK